MQRTGHKKPVLVTVGLELRQVVHSAVCGDSPPMLPPKELLTLIPSKGIMCRVGSAKHRPCRGTISKGQAGLAGSSQTNGKGSDQNRLPEKKVSIRSKAQDSWVEFFYVYFINFHLFKMDILSLSSKFYVM